MTDSKINKVELKNSQYSKEELLPTLKNIFIQYKINTRSQYRSYKKAFPTLNWPSCNCIEKIFGSFSDLKTTIFGDTVDSDISKMKEQVQKRREELFGTERSAYSWEKESRKGAGLGHFVNRD